MEQRERRAAAGVGFRGHLQPTSAEDRLRGAEAPGRGGWGVPLAWGAGAPRAHPVPRYLAWT